MKITRYTTCAQRAGGIVLHSVMWHAREHAEPIATGASHRHVGVRFWFVIRWDLDPAAAYSSC